MQYKRPIPVIPVCLWGWQILPSLCGPIIIRTIRPILNGSIVIGFVLSNGHGSMLHYALLHLTGYDLSMDEIRNFRQLHSKTPGHPEVDITPGIETTTGPLLSLIHI